MTTPSHITRLRGTFLLPLLCAGCEGTDAVDDSGLDGAGGPGVVSTDPFDSARDVTLNQAISATFSEAMDPASLTVGTFTLTSGSSPVEGTVIYADQVATFWPAVHLDADTCYTATVSAGVDDEAGLGLDEDYAWSFTTGDTLGPGRGVYLGDAGNYAVLAKSGISTVPASAITGDIGVSPAAATYITGFSLTADPSNRFATSPQVSGRVYAADYATPTPGNLTTAVHDMERAFTDAAGRAPDVTELGAGNIAGMTLEPGVYKWGTGVLIPTDVTLEGSGTDIWIFQIAQDLTVGNGAAIVLTGGALPENVFWQVSGLVDIGTTAHVEGIVVTQTSLSLRTGATLNGRLLAQTAVDLDGGTVTVPAP